MTRPPVRRLLAWQRIDSVIAKRLLGPEKNIGPALTADLLRRDVTGVEPTQLSLTETTEHENRGTLYGRAMEAIFSNRTVGYSIPYWMVATLTV